MKTAFLLMAQYDGLAVIPVDKVCRDYFTHLSPAKFVEQARKGEISIPLVRLGASQKAAKGVHLQDLADYIDKSRESARKDLDNLA